jgi:ectoine hydroxylase-related dioxygenase (phytanoyl-CoA dioxygenase family)
VVFDKFTTYRQLVINPSKENQSTYYTPINTVTPKTHDILLFPSDLTHQAESNLSDKPRYSIAFNCFVKGKLGDLRDVSQFNL